MLLDTDVLIDLLRGRAPALAWYRALQSHPQVSGIAAIEALWVPPTQLSSAACSAS